MINPFETIARREIELGLGKPHAYYALPALEEQRRRPHLAPAGVAAHRARVAAAELRRQARDGASTCARSRAGSRTRKREDGDSVHRRRASCSNCAAGIPLLGDLTAMRGAVKRMGCPARHGRARGAGRHGARPHADRRLPRHAGRARAQHGSSRSSATTSASAS